MSLASDFSEKMILASSPLPTLPVFICSKNKLAKSKKLPSLTESFSMSWQSTFKQIKDKSLSLVLFKTLSTTSFISLKMDDGKLLTSCLFLRIQNRMFEATLH